MNLIKSMSVYGSCTRFEGYLILINVLGKGMNYVGSSRLGIVFKLILGLFVDKRFYYDSLIGVVVLMIVGNRARSVISVIVVRVELGTTGKASHKMVPRIAPAAKHDMSKSAD